MMKINFIQQTLVKIKSCLRTNKHTKDLYNRLYSLKEMPRKKRKQKKIQKRGFEVIDKINRIFKTAGIMYFVDFGTLLGMVREKGFIKHDLDVDIGVLINPSIGINSIRESLANNGFILKFEYVFKDMIVEDSFIYKGIKIDFCYYRNDDLFSKCWLFYRKPDFIYEDNYFSVVEIKHTKITETQTLSLYGIEMEIPINTDKILEEKYGKCWKVPDKKWVYWKAPNAVDCDEIGYCIVHT